MAAQLAGLGPNSSVIDLGAGYGGSARGLASIYGCRVTCLNLSKTQNDLNRGRNAEAGLSDLISVTHGSFEDIPEPDSTFDVVWSQDAILHSGDRPKVLDEIARVLKPDGRLIFTDPMQSDDCPSGVLQPILDRIHLETLGSFAFYREELGKRGFTEVSVTPLTNHLRMHYARVGEELRHHYDEIVALSGRDYVENMLRGLRHWIDGADRGYLAWGIMHFRLTA
jgi:sarcosine/dimethylglycine N-methyltransferase